MDKPTIFEVLMDSQITNNRRTRFIRIQEDQSLLTSSRTRYGKATICIALDEFYATDLSLNDKGTPEHFSLFKRGMAASARKIAHASYTFTASPEAAEDFKAFSEIVLRLVKFTVKKKATKTEDGEVEQLVYESFESEPMKSNLNSQTQTAMDKPTNFEVLMDSQIINNRRTRFIRIQEDQSLLISSRTRDGKATICIALDEFYATELLLNDEGIPEQFSLFKRGMAASARKIAHASYTFIASPEAAEDFKAFSDIVLRLVKFSVEKKATKIDDGEVKQLVYEPMGSA